MIRLHTIPHPSAIIRSHYLEDSKITITELAKILDVSRPHLNEFMNGKVSISIDFAYKLSKAFKTTPQLWLNMQNSYDLRKLEDDKVRVEKLLHNVKVFELA